MIGDTRFLRKNIVEVDAAVVGVGKARWKALCIKKKDDVQAAEQEAKRLMQEHRFDVLPIEETHSIQEYYRTADWNDFDRIQRRDIQYEDTLPLRTSVRDAIHALASNERTFYFLEHEGHIAGLLTAASLNCRQVRVFLYALVGELEIRLGRLLHEHFDEEELLSMVSKRVRGPYEKAKRQGVESDITEYFYLESYGKIILSEDLYPELGLSADAETSEEDKCLQVFKGIKEMRNAVAHQKSLIKAPHSIHELWERIEHTERLIFNLRQTEQARSPLPDVHSLIG